MKIVGMERCCKWGGIFLLAMLSACSTIDVSNAPALSAADSLAVLPIANFTETPEAGQRAQSIAESMLHQKGFANLQRYPQNGGSDLLMSGNANQTGAQALEWARSAGAQYALTGSVNEWRYKVGVDGEPVVGLTFTLIDVSSGATVWSATGSRSGWSRSSVAGVGQTLIRQLLAPLTLR